MRFGYKQNGMSILNNCPELHTFLSLHLTVNINCNHFYPIILQLPWIVYSVQERAKIVHTTSSDSATIQQNIQTPTITFNMAESKRVHIEKAQNFMRQYRDPESRELKKLSANQFMDVWSHYDRDGKCCEWNIDFSTRHSMSMGLCYFARKNIIFIYL